uniref:Alcohol dehydrogenase 7 (class IV), mu or sigma polypeptide n=1 Tax=Bos indicus x Bos taurus TaxID=30522 RepID=A0A4W2GKL0_BOBOX
MVVKEPSLVKYYVSTGREKVIKCKVALLWEQKKPFSTEIQVVPHASTLRLLACGMGSIHIRLFYPLTLMTNTLYHVFSLDDKVIPHFLPQCRECNACRNPDGNPVFDISNSITGHGVLADGSTRFTCKGEPVYHFLSTSTFIEFTAVDEPSIAKSDDAAPPEKVCLTGCGFSTGYRATIKIGKVTPSSTCVVFGLGGVGLSVIMGCNSAGASRIVGADLNKDKFEKAMAVGATECISPKDFTKPISEVLSEMTGDTTGCSFEVIGHLETMARTLEWVAISFSNA